MGQNIYGNDRFYNNYKELRSNSNNTNVLEEIPALYSLLPDLKDRKVLDLGCGTGESTLSYYKNGASYVMGIDCPHNMLTHTLELITPNKVYYALLPIENLHEMTKDFFDLVVSSLAIYYIEDYKKLCKDVYNLLLP